MKASRNLTSGNEDSRIVVVTGKREPLITRSKILVEIEREINRFNTFYRNALNSEGKEREAHVKMMSQSVERIREKMEKEDVPKDHKSWDWIKRANEILSNM